MALLLGLQLPAKEVLEKVGGESSFLLASCSSAGSWSAVRASFRP
jgi:hypothetical protein